jgi:hypothetical protein
VIPVSEHFGTNESIAKPYNLWYEIAVLIFLIINLLAVFFAALFVFLSAPGRCGFLQGIWKEGAGLPVTNAGSGRDSTR